MVSNVSGNAGLGAMQQMMAAMQQKMKSANIDEKEGFSKDEISAINTGDDKGGSRFLSELTKNFDKIDGNGDGQLSKEEVKASRPPMPMGPPPGMKMDGPPPEMKSGGSSTDKTYDKLDTNEDGEVSISERLAGEKAESKSLDAAKSTDSSSKSSSNSAITSYASKLLSNYKKDSSESTSSFDFAA